MTRAARSTETGHWSELRHLPRALALAWSAAKTCTAAWVLVLALQGCLPILVIYVSKRLVDILVPPAGMVRQNATHDLIACAATLAFLLLLTDCLESISEWIRVLQAARVQDYITGLVHEKSVAVDLGFYELPEYHDHLYRARDEAGTRPLALLDCVGAIVQNGITFVAMCAVLVPYALWLPALLVVSSVPALFVALRSHRRRHQWWVDSTTVRRWARYYDSALTEAVIAPEIRLYGLGDRFRTAYKAHRGTVVAGEVRLLRSQNFARLAAGAISTGIGALAIGLIVLFPTAAHTTLGDLVVVVQAFYRGQNLTRVLLSNAGQVYANALFLGNLFQFLSLAPKVIDPPHPVPVPRPLRSGIAFRNVSFRYPGTDRYALRDLNLEIAPSQVVAIVGLNGAGKSTVLKLLCRFYDTTEGRIEFDGIDIRHFEVAELRDSLSVLMQVPQSYQCTVANNIAIGDLRDGATRNGDIRDAAVCAGAHDFIRRLPNEYDTELGKWFPEGTEISPGEKQRIALARAFLRRASVLVLDEPTSFMDPWSEDDWYERFHSLARGRTCILITHRLNIAMRADVIHVMDDGRIVESGTHEQLLSAGGLYWRSWNAQLSVQRPHAAAEFV